MTTTKTKLNAKELAAWKAARREGVSYYIFSRFSNPELVDFIGQTWEDGGLIVDKDGEPRCDIRGNNLATYRNVKLDQNNPTHVAAVLAWYGE